MVLNAFDPENRASIAGVAIIDNSFFEGYGNSI